MTEFIKSLQKEQKRLENIRKQVDARLADAPEGSLRVSTHKNNVQYYHYGSRERKGGIYIPKSQGELIKRLAQKSYDEKIKKFVEKRLPQITRILQNYERDDMEKIYIREGKERQKWIHPVELTWEQRVDAWEKEEYVHKEFQEGTAIILTEKGERVRSKSEKILADYFYKNGIPYKYEKPLYLNKIGFVHPDFTLLSRKTGEEIYWEHNGKMDDPKYVENAVRKIHAYEFNNIYPGERLILTFETGMSVLDIRMVKKFAEKYLL